MIDRDDILRMAREAGMEVHERKGEIRIGSAAITGCDSTEQVTRFAALVAAAEREAFAAGVQGLFEADELRRVVGFEPLQDGGMPTEGAGQEVQA